MSKKYAIFTRNWWRYNSDWPDGKEPHIGRKKIIGYAETIEKARGICDEWNKNNDPGPLSRKAEFTDVINLR